MARRHDERDRHLGGACAVELRMSEEKLHDSIAAADLRALLMCLFHLTGDEKWLAAPYTPVRGTQLIPDPEAGLPEHVRRDIRSTAASLLHDGVPTPAVSRPSPELFGRMLSHCLGEEVPPEYVPMMYADFGFDDGDPEEAPLDPDLDVVVVGAGVSGICLASKLLRAGVHFTVFERNPEVGGTWFENRYPGCGVDTPNHFYSYSFRPNPGWSYYFSPRTELQQYLEDAATELGIREHTRFDATVRSARWDELERRWHIDVSTADDGDLRVTARVLVGATGHFSRPREIDFPGLDVFRGELFHTARWPEGTVLTGQRVAVVGTGASAMQVVPSIVDDVGTLTVFQRTPQWCRPVREYNLPVRPAARWLFERLPFYGGWYRFTEFWRFGDGLLRFLRRDPEWPFPDRSVNSGNDRHREELLDHLRTQLEGRPDLIARCTPTYPPFGKRMLIDNGWYAALRRAHVTLETDPIERFEPGGVRVASGRIHRMDAVILATGFDIVNLAAEIDIRGRGSRSLADDWAADDPTAHLGMTVPGFPNLFVMFGPNTNMGHGGSGMWLAETQSRYIVECLRLMSEQRVAALEVREHVRAQYIQQVDALHEELVWSHRGVRTYYRNSSGKVRSPMPFRLVDYWHLTKEPKPEHFDLTPCS